MMSVALPALCALVGLLVYGLTAHKQIGAIMFGCGLVVVVYLTAGHTVHF